MQQAGFSAPLADAGRNSISAFVHEVSAVIDANGAALAEQAPLLRQEHALLEHVGATLETASDRAPCVGLVTLDAARKTDLGVKLAGGANPNITTRVAGAAIGYPQQVSFCGPGNVTSMVLRLTRIVRETSSDLPLSISLLGELDLVHIFAAIALEELDLVTEGGRLAHGIRQSCESALQIREPWQGGTISQQEITALQAALLKRFPDHPHLLRLDACGYWEALRATIAHLSVYDRATILAQLWGGQHELTVLFSQMTQALERLDFAQDVRCGLDAIVEFDELERPLASSHSILSGRVVCEMMERIEHPAIVATPTGKQLSLSRPMLGALGAEVQIEVLTQHEQGDLDADVLEFPRLPLQGEVSRPLAPRALHGAYAHGKITQLLWRFAQEKAAFLFERATQHHEITALVMVLPIGAAVAPDRPSVVADWVDRLQGAEAGEREASETALFVTVTGDSEQLTGYALKNQQTAGLLQGSTDQLNPTRATDGTGQAIETALTQVFAGRQSARERWTSTAPFRSISIYRHADSVGRGLFDRGRNGAELGLNLKRAAEWHKAGHAFTSDIVSHGLVADPSIMWAEASKPNDGGAGHLARLLTGVVKRQQKLFHIQRHFAGDARRLMRRLQYHIDLPTAQGEARINRERDYVVTVQRLQGLVGTERFTMLLERLCIDERRLRDLLATILYNPAILSGKAAGLSRTRRGGSRPEAAKPDDGRTIDLSAAQRDEERDTIAVDFAVAALRQWVRDVRVLAQRSDQQARFDLPEPLFLNLVEELIAGAVRRDLRTQLANSVRATLGDNTRDQLECAEAAAALICDTLGRYVTWLGYEDAWSQEYPLRPGSDSQGIFAPRMAVKGQAPAINVATQSATFSLDWITAFKALVEENAKAFQVRKMRRAQLRGGDGDLDAREPGRDAARAPVWDRAPTR